MKISILLTSFAVMFTGIFSSSILKEKAIPDHKEVKIVWSSRTTGATGESSWFPISELTVLLNIISDSEKTYPEIKHGLVYR